MKNLMRDYKTGKGNKIAFYVLIGLAVATLVFSILFYALMPRPYSLEYFDFSKPNYYKPKYKKMKRYNYYYDYNEPFRVPVEFYDLVRNGGWEVYDNIYRYDYKKSTITKSRVDVLLYDSLSIFDKNDVSNVIVEYDDSLPSHAFYTEFYVLNPYSNVSRDTFDDFMFFGLNLKGDDERWLLYSSGGYSMRSTINGRDFNILFRPYDYKFPSSWYNTGIDYCMKLVCSPDLTVEKWDDYCDENGLDHRWHMNGFHTIREFFNTWQNENFPLIDETEKIEDESGEGE